jgi:hypothetical protein
VVFVVTQNIKSAEDTSIKIEWLGFMVQSILYSVFFVLHSFPVAPTTLPPREEYQPLFSGGRYLGDVESGTI